MYATQILSEPSARLTENEGPNSSWRRSRSSEREGSTWYRYWNRTVQTPPWPTTIEWAEVGSVTPSVGTLGTGTGIDFRMGGSRSGSTCTTASEIGVGSSLGAAEGSGSSREIAYATAMIVTSPASPPRISAAWRGRSRRTDGSIAARRSAASAAGSGRALGSSSTPVTANTCQVPGTPFSSCAEKSSKPNPDPVTSSLVVLVTRMSPASASDITRAPITTAMPWVLPA